MSVVNTKFSFSISSPEDKCSVCDAKLWPPFVEWHGHTNIFICGECCDIRHSLMADLIQCAAIVEINRFEHFRGTTLVRELTKKVEEADEKKNSPEFRFQKRAPFADIKAARERMKGDGS